MSQNYEVEEVIETALIKLDDKLREGCLKNNYFVTAIGLPPRDIITIIDTEKTFTYDKELFEQHTRYLYDLFTYPRDWYKC